MPRSLLLSLIGLTAAIVTACAPAPERRASGARRDILLPLDTSIIRGRVPRNATLQGLLRQNAIEPDVASSLAAAAQGVFNPRDLRADRSYRLVKTLDGLFREFQYQIDAERFLRIVFHDRRSEGQPQFDVAVLPYPKVVTVDAVSAEITREHSSLVGAFDAIGENLQLPLELAAIFGGEVDFNSELQQGDRATVLVERVTRDDGPAGYGDIQGAVLANAGRRLTAVRFIGTDGKPAWYDETGRSLKRQFLRSPLPFEPRITSGFSYRRLHPVYGGYRAHLGVDYAAPIGTAVISVAAGTVVAAGWSGDAGRMVAVRHTGGYETAYLHLSSFAPGIRPGAHVTQGQSLGRVGSSGAATGPHLDYRVKKDGVAVNPILELSRMPAGEPIAPALMGAFEQERDRVLQQLKK